MAIASFCGTETWTGLAESCLSLFILLRNLYMSVYRSRRVCGVQCSCAHLHGGICRRERGEAEFGEGGSSARGEQRGTRGLAQACRGIARESGVWVNAMQSVADIGAMFRKEVAGPRCGCGRGKGVVGMWQWRRQ